MVRFCACRIQCLILEKACSIGLRWKRRHAGNVVGIHSDPHYLRKARFAAEASGLDVEFHPMRFMMLASFI
jgi:tRNA (mo5U34)-methyltransferase